VKHKTVDPVAGAVGSAASAVSHSASHAKDAIAGKGKDWLLLMMMDNALHVQQ
jgi:hypothetical protein